MWVLSGRNIGSSCLDIADIVPSLASAFDTIGNGHDRLSSQAKNPIQCVWYAASGQRIMGSHCKGCTIKNHLFSGVAVLVFSNFYLSFTFGSWNHEESFAPTASGFRVMACVAAIGIIVRPNLFRCQLPFVLYCLCSLPRRCLLPRTGCSAFQLTYQQQQQQHTSQPGLLSPASCRVLALIPICLGGA